MPDDETSLDERQRVEMLGELGSLPFARPPTPVRCRALV